MSETEAGGKAGHIVDDYGDPQRADVMREQEYSGADVDLKDQKVVQPFGGSGHGNDRWSVR